MKYYQHNIGDHLSIAAHLTVIEDGILRRAMDYCLANECALPSDLSDVMRVLRVTHGVTDEALCVTLSNALRNVLDEFFTLRNDEYHCDAVDKILSGYHEKAPSIERGRSANAERQAKLRERKKELQAFIINTLGVTASDRLSVKDLEKIIADHGGDKSVCVTRDADEMRNVNNALPNHKPRTINQEPLTNNHEPAFKSLEAFGEDLENQKRTFADHQIDELPQAWATSIQADWPDLHPDDMQAKWNKYWTNAAKYPSLQLTSTEIFEDFKTRWIDKDAPRLIELRKSRASQPEPRPPVPISPPPKPAAIGLAGMELVVFNQLHKQDPTLTQQVIFNLAAEHGLSTFQILQDMQEATS